MPPQQIQPLHQQAAKPLVNQQQSPPPPHLMNLGQPGQQPQQLPPHLPPHTQQPSQIQEKPPTQEQPHYQPPPPPQHQQQSQLQPQPPHQPQHTQNQLPQLAQLPPHHSNPPANPHGAPQQRTGLPIYYTTLLISYQLHHKYLNHNNNINNHILHLLDKNKLTMFLQFIWLLDQLRQHFLKSTTQMSQPQHKFHNSKGGT